MNALHNFTYHAVDQWIESFPNLRVLGPLTTASADYARILDFRTEWHRRDAPYLTDAFQAEIEETLQLEERSLHFALESDGQIIACVRASPPPLEISALSNDFKKNLTDFGNYYEFSRLCTNRALGRKALYAMLLVVKTAAHLFSNDLADGVVGICRDARFSYMKRVGLHSDFEPVWLEQRQGSYQLIHASKDQLLSFYADHLRKTLIDKKTEIKNESEAS